jgi:hypothetical protein
MSLLIEQSMLASVADSTSLSEIVHMRFDEGGLICTTVLADTLLKIDEYLLVMTETEETDAMLTPELLSLLLILHGI